MAPSTLNSLHSSSVVTVEGRPRTFSCSSSQSFQLGTPFEVERLALTAAGFVGLGMVLWLLLPLLFLFLKLFLAVVAVVVVVVVVVLVVVVVAVVVVEGRDLYAGLDGGALGKVDGRC